MNILVVGLMLSIAADGTDASILRRLKQRGRTLQRRLAVAPTLRGRHEIQDRTPAAN